MAKGCHATDKNYHVSSMVDSSSTKSLIAHRAVSENFQWLDISPFWRGIAADERQHLDHQVIEEMRHLSKMTKQGLVRTLVNGAKQLLAKAGVSNKELAERLGVSNAAVSQWFNPPIPPTTRSNLIDSSNFASLVSQPECGDMMAEMLVNRWDLPIGQVQHCLHWIQGLLADEAMMPPERAEFEVLFHGHLANSGAPQVPPALFEVFPRMQPADIVHIMQRWGKAYRLLVSEMTMEGQELDSRHRR